MRHAVAWVGQEDPRGCAIACAAMMVGCTYQEAKAFFLKHQADAGAREVGGFEKQQFLEAAGWERCGYYPEYRFLRGELPGVTTWPPPPVPGAEICECGVQCTPDPYLAHAVLLLPDGTVLDPARADRVPSLVVYHRTQWVTGWRRKGAA